MEELLNYNWNVYKVFKSGKRAKAPLMTFEHCESGAMEHFEEEIKKNFNERLREMQFTVLRADVSQEMAEDPRKKILLDQKQVIQRYLTADLKKLNLSWGLIYAKASEWQWQWAFLESGTNRYMAPISPKFKIQKEAYEWMNQQITALE